MAKKNKSAEGQGATANAIAVGGYVTLREPNSDTDAAEIAERVADLIGEALKNDPELALRCEGLALTTKAADTVGDAIGDVARAQMQVVEEELLTTAITDGMLLAAIQKLAEIGQDDALMTVEWCGAVAQVVQATETRRSQRALRDAMNTVTATDGVMKGLVVSLMNHAEEAKKSDPPRRPGGSGPIFPPGFFGGGGFGMN